MDALHAQGLYKSIDGRVLPENPKVVGSGVVTCRPQAGPCDGRCQDCYFSSGRYYESIMDPHIPDPDWVNSNDYIVRVNDGNDSNYKRPLVEGVAHLYKRKFFCTRIPKFGFDGPVEFTVNGDYTDQAAWMVPYSSCKELMAVRVRTNLWNLDLVRAVCGYYKNRGVPVLITYMAYQNEPEDSWGYHQATRTINEYWVLRPQVRDLIEEEELNFYLDGESALTCTSRGSYACKDCMNCKTLYERWEVEHGRGNGKNEEGLESGDTNGPSRSDITSNSNESTFGDPG